MSETRSDKYKVILVIGNEVYNKCIVTAKTLQEAADKAIRRLHIRGAAFKLTEVKSGIKAGVIVSNESSQSKKPHMFQAEVRTKLPESECDGLYQINQTWFANKNIVRVFEYYDTEIYMDAVNGCFYSIEIDEYGAAVVHEIAPGHPLYKYYATSEFLMSYNDAVAAYKAGKIK